MHLNKIDCHRKKLFFCKFPQNIDHPQCKRKFYSNKQFFIIFFYFLDTRIYTVSALFQYCASHFVYIVAHNYKSNVVVAPSPISLFNVCEFVLIHTYFVISIPICLAIKSKSNRNSLSARVKRVHFFLVFWGQFVCAYVGVCARRAAQLTFYSPSHATQCTFGRMQYRKAQTPWAPIYHLCK